MARLEPTTQVAAERPPSSYPAVDPGIECRSIVDMLAANQDFINRIKLCYGSDRQTFERDLLTPIRNYASFVNLLPATADNFFCSAGGLFRLGLEVGFIALQGTDGHIVSGRATISTRRHLEPRWRQATFIAGLCSELHRTLSQVVVTDDRGELWPAYLQPLSTWLEGRGARRFFVRWLANSQESRALGLFALPHIVPPATMQHLATDNKIAVPQLLACLSGAPLYREQNILIELVKRAAALVIDRDLIASANRYGRPILGAHLERYLIDAMRRLLVTDAKWTPNSDKARVWHAKDGLFLVWPNAAEEIRKLLEADELPGIPKAPETIVEILLSAGVLVGKDAEHPLWSISPPPGKTVMDAVKLASPDILLPPHSDLPAPLSIEIVVRASSAAAAPSAEAAPPTQPPSSPPSPQQAPAGQTPDLFASAEQEVPAVASTGLVRQVDEHGEILNHTSEPQQAPNVPAGRRAHGKAEAPSAPAPPSPHFKLKAPMRLIPQVRDVLAVAIDSLNGEAKQASAVTVSRGVFVPLDFFKRQRVDASVALRALADCAMAISDARSRVATLQHEMSGKTEIGIVIKPDFVAGLNPADFATSN